MLAAMEVAGEVEPRVDTATALVGCPDCAVVAAATGRWAVTVQELPVGGRPVVRVWQQPDLVLPAALAPATVVDADLGCGPVSGSVGRAGRRVDVGEVGRKGRSTAEVAGDLGVGGATVGRTVVECGRPAVEDPAWLAGGEGFGVDQTAFLTATAASATLLVTGVVEVTGGRPTRLLDVVSGRSSRVSAWIADRE